jgi:hypothetical protein
MTKFDEYYKLIMEQCWKGYEQVGMKEKNGKMVPNCVPKKKKKKKK